MNTDQYGLPVQLDRDAADQLQRVGMLAIADNENTLWSNALITNLQPFPGYYCRYTGATTLDVTADQLIPVMAYWVLTSNIRQCNIMSHIRAQNTRKQGEPNVKTNPDFMLIRALPLLVRKHANSSWLLYPVILFVDILLILASITFVLLNRKIDNVDDNNLIVTLITCEQKYSTFLSRFACLWYKSYRAKNAGSLIYNVHPIIGAMRWYHRAAWPSYGNPEIAMLYEPLIHKYILK